MAAGFPCLGCPVLSHTCGTLATVRITPLEYEVCAMDAEAARITDLVIEAGALVDWLETGRGDLEIVGAALWYLRDELARLADETGDAEACQAACETVAVIDDLVARPPAPAQRHAA